MSVDPQQLHVGMDVVGNDGEFVGTVKSVSDDAFELNRPWARDLIVPMTAIRAIVGSSATQIVSPHAMLEMRAHSVDAQGWPHTS